VYLFELGISVTASYTSRLDKNLFNAYFVWKLIGNYYLQVVILIGLGPSSFDISKDIAGVAKEVHVATQPNPLLKGMKLENVRNICFHTVVR